MTVSLKTLPRFAFRHLDKAPLHFFLLQGLNGLASFVAKLLETRFEHNPILAGLLFFPAFCIASTYSCALTYLSFVELEKGNPVSLSKILSLLGPHLKKLTIASLALGLVFVLGLAALILPALYFMAVYLFVPLLLIDSKDLSLSLALFRSTKLAKKFPSTAAFTVFLILFIGVLTFLVSYSLGRYAGGISQDETVRFVLSGGIDAFLTMLTGAMIDLWIAGFFLKAKEAANE